MGAMQNETKNREVIAPPDEATIARAVTLLRTGEPVGMPTETVYGLAADACNDLAIAKIFELKGRPRFNPLIVHCQDAQAVGTLVEFPPLALQLAEHFWPGPLTLVLPRIADCPVSLLASAGLDTLAVRVPAHPAAHQLLLACGGPLAAPSANISGRISPTTAAAVAEDLPLELVLDGGPCKIGLESTILAVEDATLTLLRPGGISVEEIEAATGSVVVGRREDNKVTAPGQLRSHYAPSATLRLDAHNVQPEEALLAFGKPLPGTAREANLSPSGDLREAAANLFTMLRTLDAPDIDSIAVMPVPEHGLGRAINDRLRRAAAPRDSHVPG